MGRLAMLFLVALSAAAAACTETPKLESVSRPYLLAQPRQPENKELACSLSKFWERYANTPPDPEAYKVWSGNWEWWGQPDIGAAAGGNITRGTFLPLRPEEGTLVFAGDRSDCVQCLFKLRAQRMRMDAKVVGTFLILLGLPDRLPIFWYEKHGDEVLLFGALDVRFFGCLERRGKKLM